MYSMTQAGQTFLHNWVTLLALPRATLDRFLGRLRVRKPRP